MGSFRRQHPDTDVLRRGIDRCVAFLTAFSGKMCRAVSARYANSQDLLTGEGAKKHGGRWNPPGLFRAVYGTLDPYAALAETVGVYGHYNIPFEQRLPLVLIAIDVRLVRVLDLTDGKLRRHLGVSKERMLVADWQIAQTQGSEGLTQAIGRLAWEANVEALLVPSLKLKKERNLVVFPDQMQKRSQLKIVNRRELPEPR
jgi:RES domain-containing protein